MHWKQFPSTNHHSSFPLRWWCKHDRSNFWDTWVVVYWFLSNVAIESNYERLLIWVVKVSSSCLVRRFIFSAEICLDSDCWGFQTRLAGYKFCSQHLWRSTLNTMFMCFMFIIIIPVYRSRRNFIRVLWLGLVGRCVLPLKIGCPGISKIVPFYQEWSVWELTLEVSKWWGVVEQYYQA